MNCQDFETTIVDLAREQLVEHTERESALAHAAGCSECGGRLADERALSTSLGRLAAASQVLEAPHCVEVALRAAYRERASLPASPARTPYHTRVREWRRWAVAAVAAILVLLAFVAWRIERTPLRLQPQPQVSATPDLQTEQARASDQIPSVAPPRNSQVKRANSPRGRRKQDLRGYRAGELEHRERSEDRAPEVEIATDFMPVSGASLIPLEGGSVVRVELPRSALESFGLPMNLERAEERIKADVVIGNDGLARAIRFVR